MPGRCRLLSAQFQPPRLAAMPRHPRPRPSDGHAIVALELGESSPVAQQCRGAEGDLTAGLIDSTAGQDLRMEGHHLRRAVVAREIPDPAVPSMPADSRPRPSGWKATEPTSIRSRWRKGGESGSPVIVSQTRAVPSRLLVASRRPSGLKAAITT